MSYSALSERPRYGQLQLALVFSWIAGLSISLSVLLSGPLSAEELSPTEQTAAIATYRRLFVPADSPENWPVGPDRLLPIARGEFDRLIKQSAESNHHARTPRIRSAVFQAKLMPDNTLRGTAQWSVELPDDEPRLLRLAPLNLAVESAEWQNTPQRQVAFGLWGSSSKSNDRNASPVEKELATLVQASDVLQCHWRLAPTQADGTAQQFDLQLPSAVPQTFQLTLPEQHSAELTHALLLEKQPRADGAFTWIFQLAARTKHRLRIHSPLETLVAQRLPLASQTTVYQLEPTGLNVVTQIRLDARESQLTELKVEIPAALAAVKVEIDQQPVAWQISNERAGRWLRIARPESRQPQTVEIHALAKLRPRVLWQLPKLRLDQVAWTEGSSRLLVSPELELRVLTPRKASLQHIVGIDENLGEGEVYRIREWSAEADLTIQVSRPASRVSARMLTTISLDEEDATASIAAILDNDGGDVYQLQGAVAPGWMIDSVTTSPVSWLNEWHVDRDGEDNNLFLQLNQPLTKNRSLEVVIQARRIAQESKLIPKFQMGLLPATVGQLKLVRFAPGNIKADVLQLLAPQQRAVDVAVGPGVEPAMLRELPPEFASFAATSGNATLLDALALRDDELVALRDQTSAYDATVQIAVEVLPDALLQHYQVDCRLHTESAAEVALQFDEPLPEDMRWNIDGQDLPLQLERMESDSSEQLREQPSSYLLRIPRGVGKEFRLKASYAQDVQLEQRCNLVRLPQVTQWKGRLVLRGPLTGVKILDQGWTPMAPSEQSSTDSQLPTLGVYRLGAEEYRRGKLVGGLVLRRHDQADTTPSLVAWLAEHQTLQAANGDAIQTSSYSLENLGANQAIVALPRGAGLQEAWLDGQLIPRSQIVLSEGGYRIRLPQAKRWPFLALKFATKTPELGGTATIAAPVPECSFPILRSRWTLWAPEQYAIDDPHSARHGQGWKRLFGPLARTGEETVFMPWEGSQWRQLWAEPLVVQVTKQAAEALGKELAQRFSVSSEASLANTLDESLQVLSVGLRLLVDRPALIARGIDPGAPLSQWYETRSSIDRDDLQPPPLSSYQLALIVHSDAVILTTAERVAHWYDHLRPTDTVGVYVVHSDQLAERIEKHEGPAHREFVEILEWREAPTRVQSPWNSALQTKLVDVGRRARTVEFFSEKPQMVVRRAFAERGLWHAVLLLTIVIGVGWLAGFPNTMLLAAILVAAACLAVSPVWVAVPQAVFLGLLTAAMIRLVSKHRQAEFGSRNLPYSVKRSVGLTAVLLSVWLGSAVLAQTSKVQGDIEAKRSLPRVFIPVDSQGERQGNEVFLPTQFLETLQRQARPAPRDGAAFVILAADYQGGLSRDYSAEASVVMDSKNSRMQLAEPWTLSWKIESFQPNCLVALPLHRADANWLAAAHRLDGLPAEIQWHPEGKHCTVELPEAGVHRLEIVGHPHLSLQGREATVQMRVPPLPGARLHLAVPPRAKNLRVPQAVEDLRTPSLARWRGLLVGSKTLALHWTLQPSRDDATTWQRLEQRSWLHVEPAAAWVDVQLAVTDFQSSTNVLELEVSPQLQLEPLGEESLVEQVLPALSEQPTRLRLKMRPGISSDFVVPLRFELQREVSVGRIPFPRINVLGSTPAKQLFAVSVASGLSYDEQTSDLMRTLQPVEFTDAWRVAEKQPLFAYALGTEEPDWSLRVWPDPLAFRAHQRLQVKCSPSLVEVVFDATLSEVTGPWHAHRLRVPASFQIDAVRVIDQSTGNEVPLRWSHASETEVVLFLNRPLEQAHTLKLEGHRHVASQSMIDVPVVRLLAAERSEVQLDLYRSEHMQVHWMEPHLVPQKRLKQDSSISPEEILVGRYSWRVSQLGPISKIRLERNIQEFEADSVTTVQLALAGWEARHSSHIVMQRGVLSRLRLVAPESFRLPYRLDPTEVGTIDEVRETSSGKEITVALAKPLSAGQQLTLSLTGRMSLPADQRLVVPSLRWSGASSQDRYVSLPTRIHQQPLQWQTQGLRRQSLPAQLDIDATPRSNHLSFRVNQDNFQAAERIYGGTLRTARIRSTHVTAVINAAGQISATAEILLQPGRATSCDVKLPPGSNLVQLIVGDRSARRDMLEGGSWKVTTGPPYMPVRIVVCYQSQVDISGGRVNLVPPDVIFGAQALPHHETWWHVVTTESLQLGDPVVGTRQDRTRLVRNRYRQSLLVLEDSLSQALELPREEAQAWANSWLALCGAAESESHRLGFNTDDQQGLEEASLARAALAKLSSSESATLDALHFPLSYPPTLAVDVEPTSRNEDHSLVATAKGPLTLATTVGKQSNLWRPLAALALLSAGGALLLRLQREPHWYLKLGQAPHALALVCGLTWWLLMKPSVLGLLIISIALISLAISRYPRRTDSSDLANHFVEPTG